MDSRSETTRRQAILCSIASLALGAYLSSMADNLAMRVLFFSIPPASLLVTLRRELRQQNLADAVGQTHESIAFNEITSGLEFDILSRAS